MNKEFLITGCPKLDHKDRFRLFKGRVKLICSKRHKHIHIFHNEFIHLER